MAPLTGFLVRDVIWDGPDGHEAVTESFEHQTTGLLASTNDRLLFMPEVKNGRKEIENTGTKISVLIPEEEFEHIFRAYFSRGNLYEGTFEL